MDLSNWGVPILPGEEGAGEAGTFSAASEALEEDVREKALPRWVSLSSVDGKLAFVYYMSQSHKSFSSVADEVMVPHWSLGSLRSAASQSGGGGDDWDPSSSGGVGVRTLGEVF